jgi:type IV pilus assembly protein PilM
MSGFAWLKPTLPDVAVAIDRGQVSAARVSWRQGQPTLGAEAREVLTPGMVTPSLAVANMPDVGAVGQVVARVLAQLGGRTTRVALVVPDAVAKVSLLHLDTIPPRVADLREIVRWQVRKTAPFPVEQAVLSIARVPGATGPGGDLVVTLAREEVIRQYEQACAMAGAHAGLIDLATFSVMNSVVASGGAPDGDWLLVHVDGQDLTLVVARGTDLLFFRHRSEESEGTLADLIHQTAMYYEDRLKGTGFARVWLAGADPAQIADVRRDLELRLGATVDLVASREAASLAGILARDEKVA